MSVEILPIGYYTVSVTIPEAYTIEVVTPETYTVTVSEPESYSIGITGTQGPPGPQGPAGPAGPNEITTATETDITGLLKGNGTNIEQAVDGTDYNNQDLQSVLSNGSIADIDITIKNNYTDDYSIIQPTAIGTENVGSGSYSYLSYDGYLGLSNGNAESQLKNTDVTSNGVILEFPDKASGSYTIATTDDVPNAVTSVSATSPITSSGGNTPTISTSMATNKLIGRSSSGTGTMEEISVGTGLSLSGGTLNATAGGLKSGTATASVTDVYTTTITGVTAYNTNDAYVIKFNTANSDGATLNINSIGAVQLVKNNNTIITGGDIQVGQEFIVVYDGTNFQMIGISPNQMFAYVTNADSVTINKGQVVYAFGASGDRMSVKLAYNTGDATSAKTVGFVFSSSIAANGTGYIITQGVIQGLNLGAYTAGDTLYLGATAGTFTNVKPYAPNHLVYVGIVERANSGNGQIYVRCQNGYEMDELHDVQSSGAVNKDILYRDTTVSPNLWKPASVTTVLGYTPEDTTNKSTSTGDIASSIKFPVWSAVVSYVTGLGYLLASTAASTYQTLSNLVTTFGVTPSDTKYPSEKLVKDSLDAKQSTLVSGTNIKTLEGQSLLGSGNIDLNKSDVGLSNVDNTSDLNKPISTATQAALNLSSAGNKLYLFNNY